MKCKDCEYFIDSECTEPEGQCPEDADEPVVTRLTKYESVKFRNRTQAFRHNHAAAILSKTVRKL